jgi:iron-sulfur cluster repair protein YtfE (RIC family)
MLELVWSTAARENTGTARYGILAQHQELRRLLDRIETVAQGALDGAPTGPDAVAVAVGELRSAMEIHLVFEESVLLPLMNADAEAGAARAQRLVNEHAHQRGTLAALHAEACAHPELPILAAKLAGLVAHLRDDMQEEERAVLGVV